MISGLGEEASTATVDISYSTRIEKELLLPSRESEGGATSPVNKGGTVENSAALFGKNEGDDELSDLNIVAEEEYTVPEITYLEKSVEKLDADGRILKWTVTVDRGVIPAGTDITLSDTLPESLELINTDASPAEAPTLNGNPVTLALNADRTFSLSLDEDNFNEDGKAVLSYCTKVKEEYYENGENLGSNIAKLDFQIEGTGYSPQVSLDLGQSGVGASRLVKTNAGFGENKKYLPHERSVQWKFSLNPHKAYLRSASLTDPLGNAGEDLGCKRKLEDHGKGLSLNSDYKITVEFSGDYNGNIKIAPDELKSLYEIKDNSEGIRSTVGVPNGRSLLRLISGGNDELSFTFGEIGKTSVSVSYVTVVNDPCIFAANSSFEITNTVYGEASFGKDNTSEDARLSSSATAPVTSPILKKKEPIYNYDTGLVTWSIDVNEAGLPLSDLVITDRLAEVLSYKDGSLRITPYDGASGLVAAWDETKAELKIKIESLNEKATLSFSAEADPELLGFKGAGDVKLTNTVSMEGEAFDKPFEPVYSTAGKTVTNHGLTKHGALDEDDEQIDYSIVINPFRIDLENASITDFLPEGLRVDLYSIELSKAAVTGDTGSNAEPTATVEAKVPSELWSVSSDPKANTFTVFLPDGRDSYLLSYSADILDPSDERTYTNRIAFNGEMSSMGGPESDALKVNGGGGGGGTASSLKKGSITVKKADEDGLSLPGAGFILYQWDEEKESRGLAVAAGKTDAKGELVFSSLRTGRCYELVEDEVPAGYEEKYVLKGDTGADLFWNEDGNLVVRPDTDERHIELELVNRLSKGSVGFQVVNEYDTPLPGTEFTIYEDKDCTKPIGTAVSDESGKIIFEDLPYNDGDPYYIKQTKPANDNYELPDTIYSVTIGKDGTPSSVTEEGSSAGSAVTQVVNQQKKDAEKGSLLIIKTDSKDTVKKPSGAEFALYENRDLSGEALSIKTTDKEGKAVFDGITTDKTFWLKETKAPSGYILDEEPVEILIPSSSDPCILELEFINVKRDSGGGHGGAGGSGGHSGGSSGPGGSAVIIIPDGQSGRVSYPTDPSVTPEEEKDAAKADPGINNSPTADGAGDPDSSESSELSSGDSYSASVSGGKNNDSSPVSANRDIPKTGDNTLPLALVFVVSGAVLVSMTVYVFLVRGKREKRKDFRERGGGLRRCLHHRF